MSTPVRLAGFSAICLVLGFAASVLVQRAIAEDAQGEPPVSLAAPSPLPPSTARSPVAVEPETAPEPEPQPDPTLEFELELAPAPTLEVEPAPTPELEPAPTRELEPAPAPTRNVKSEPETSSGKRGWTQTARRRAGRAVRRVVTGAAPARPGPVVPLPSPPDDRQHMRVDGVSIAAKPDDSAPTGESPRSAGPSRVGKTPIAEGFDE